MAPKVAGSFGPAGPAVSLITGEIFTGPPPKPAVDRDHPGERPCGYCGRHRERVVIEVNGAEYTFCRRRHAIWSGYNPDTGRKID